MDREVEKGNVQEKTLELTPAPEEVVGVNLDVDNIPTVGDTKTDEKEPTYVGGKSNCKKCAGKFYNRYWEPWQYEVNETPCKKGCTRKVTSQPSVKPCTCLVKSVEKHLKVNKLKKLSKYETVFRKNNEENIERLYATL